MTSLRTPLLAVSSLLLALCTCGEHVPEDPLPNTTLNTSSSSGRTTPTSTGTTSGTTSAQTSTTSTTSTENCIPNARRCDGATIAETCSEDGRVWESETCASDHRCDPDERICKPVICLAAALQGCEDAAHMLICNETGTGTFSAPCPANAPCTDGACEGGICTPNATVCQNRQATQTCQPDGLAYLPAEPCPEGQECEDGECLDLCTINAKTSSYIGCEYWSLDLDNYDDALSQAHAVVVSNPNTERPVTVEITRFDGSPIDSLPNTDIPPLGQRAFQLPIDSQISRVEISNKSFRVTGNIPITVHQFNPLNNVDVYSNDGTLLLPTNALGIEYIVMSWPQRPDPPLRGFMTVANTSPQENTITVLSSTNTAPGPDITRLTAGEERDFVLAPGQVLNLSTAQPNDDFTGTIVRSRFPVAVFGGHECANVVLGIDRCDHIESQLFPVDTWGTEYIGSKFFPRGTEPDIWRILASQDNTTLSIDPPIEGVNGHTLQRGEFVEFESRRHIHITASAPVSVGHYMVGSNWFGIPRICDEGIDAGNPTGIGDPALTLAVPFNQFRDDYIVLIPSDYEEDYLNIIAPVDAVVTLDGEPLTAEQFEPVGDLGFPWKVASVRVEDGPHRVHADQPVGLQAYGYDCHVSYAYPGGLNLETDEEPTP